MAYIGRQLVRGQNRIYDDISSSFNGSTTAFNLTIGGDATPPAQVNQLWIILGGILQKPGTDFTVADAQVTFTTAPAAGLDFWAMIQGDTSDMNAPSDGSVTPTKIATSGDFAFPADVRFKDADGSHYVGLQAPTTVSSNLVWTLPAADGSANQILKTNGSGVLGWATDSATDSTKMPLAGGTFTGDVTFTGDSSNGLWDKSANAFVANVTGDLTGTASVASTVTLVDESSDTSCYVVFAGGATGNKALETGSNLTFDSSTGKLYVTEIIVNSNGSLFKENQLKFSPSGSAYIDHNTVDQDIVFRTSDSSALDTTALTIDASDAGTAIFNHDVKVPDNGKFLAGADGDLSIYHDASNSYIEDTGTGALKLKGDDVRVENASGNNIIKANGSVAELFHNGTKTAETTSSGLTVTGSANSATNLVIENTNNSQNAALAKVSIKSGDNANQGGMLQLECNGAYHEFESRSNGTLYISDNGTTKAYLDSNGHFGVSDGDLVIGTAGHGIDFSANSHAGGMTSELLDYYEEGSWTPTMGGGGGPSGYDTQYGRYTRIGNTCIAHFHLNCSGGPSSTDNISVNGLPFSAASGDSANACSFSYIDGFNTSFFTGMVNATNDYMRLYQTNGSYLTWNGASNKNAGFRGTIVYHV